MDSVAPTAPVSGFGCPRKRAPYLLPLTVFGKNSLPPAEFTFRDSNVPTALPWHILLSITITISSSLPPVARSLPIPPSLPHTRGCCPSRLAMASPSATPTPSPSTPDSFDSSDAATTSDLAVKISNSISLAACIAVVVSYFYFRRNNRRIMQRTSLVLAVSMASADLLLHFINIFGYAPLPKSVCGFVGGFLYAWPTLVSLFYSFSIALNTQLAFVFGKRPGQTKLKYYIGIPLAVATCITVPALATGLYGQDDNWDMCWYNTQGKTAQQVLIPYVFTFAFWCLIVIFYLVVAAVTIIVAVFYTSSRLNRLAANFTRSNNSRPSHSQPQPRAAASLGQPRYLPQRSYIQSDLAITKPEMEIEPVLPVLSRSSDTHDRSGNQTPSRALSSRPPHVQDVLPLSRRSLAMRALAIRLIGYIIVPVLCILPGVINDLLAKSNPTIVASIPESVTTFFDTLNGLVGTFSSVLYALDPALLALYSQLWHQRRQKVSANATTDRAIELNNAREQSEISDYKDADGQPRGSAAGGSSSDTRIAHFRTEGQRSNLFPLHIGRLKKQRKIPRQSMMMGDGVLIQVEVQVNRDDDIGRLENYLDGL